MTCNKCGYTMDAWDKDCPRCGGKGIDAPATGQKAKAPPGDSAAQPTSVAQALGDVKLKTGAEKYADVDRNIDLWWELIGSGIFLLLCSVGSYWYFTIWETDGGFRAMRWWVALIYKIGGKWPIVIAIAFLGLVSIAIGVNEFLSLKRDKKI